MLTVNTSIAETGPFLGIQNTAILQAISMLHLCSNFLQLLLLPSFNVVGFNVSALPSQAKQSLIFSMRKRKIRLLGITSEAVLCPWNTSIGMSQDRKDQFQSSPRTAGDRRIDIWLRQLNAFLGGITGLTFAWSSQP